jgi:NTE family protein
LKMIPYLDFQLGQGGMIGGHRLTRALAEHLGDLAIEALPLPFVALATDLVTGHEVWLQQGRLIDALRASISLPGLFAPVRTGDRWLVDGAMVNPLPVSVCRALGAQLVIAVNLHADLIGRNRWPGTGVPRAAGFDLLAELPADTPARGGLIEGALRQVFGRSPERPSLFGVMVQSLNIMQDRITRSRMAGEPPDVAINPRLGHIGLLEFHRADEAIAEGRKAAERALPELRDAIALLAG